MWTSLCNVFERKAISSQNLIRKALLTLKFQPSEYDIIVTSLETLSKEDLSIAYVKNILLDKESKRNSLGLNWDDKYEVSPSTALSSKTKPHNLTYRCHNCGKLEHKQWECWSKQKETRNNKTHNVNIASNEDDQQTENEFYFYRKRK